MNSTSDDSASNNSANTIALAAAVLAAAAFVVAFLQAALDYSSSSSSRHKCTYAAIGESARHKKMRWSFASWKLKVYYPELDFGFKGILRLFTEFGWQRIEYSTSIGNIRKPGWGWRQVKSTQIPKSNNISDGITILVDENGSFVTTKRLTWSQYIQYKWWKYSNLDLTFRRPRASWAQMLLAFGIYDTKKLTFRNVDADTIPSNIDVPIQRIGFFDLGMLASLLGFTSVKIDIAGREFRAVGPFGTITTEDVQILGKVLRFEGDILSIHQDITMCAAPWLIAAACVVNGQFCFGEYVTNGKYVTLEILSQAIREGWSNERYNKEEAIFIRNPNGNSSRRSVLQEARLLKEEMFQVLDAQKNQLVDISDDLDEGKKGLRHWKYAHQYGNDMDIAFGEISVRQRSLGFESLVCPIFAKWQIATELRVPTLFAAASFMCLPGINAGFPSSITLEPFLNWFKYICQSLLTRENRPFRNSKVLLHAVGTGDLGFAREESRYVMSTGIAASQLGLFGWGISTMKEIYDACPLEVREELLPTTDGQDSEPQALLMPNTIPLLEDFNPIKWSKSIEDGQILTLRTFYAPNLAWIQIVVLDVAIQYMIRGGWEQANRTEPAPQPNGNPSAGSPGVTSLNAAPHDGIGPRPATADTIELMPMDDTQASQPNIDVTPLAKGTGDIQDEIEAPTGGAWKAQEAQVVNAIVQAWKPADTPSAGVEEQSPENAAKKCSFQPWNLCQNLREFSGLTFLGSDEEQTRKFQKLADLLELRALFVIAFLILNLDTSDVYLAEGSGVEMPMV